jgi:hypothetical protein
MRIRSALLGMGVLMAAVGASRGDTVFYSTYAAEGNIIGSFTVPVTGIYDITAVGGGGGSGVDEGDPPKPGGVGASVEGLFSLTAGQTLDMLIGQRGFDGENHADGGGGGGTFVVILNPDSSITPLLIAGGGGGSNQGNDGDAQGAGSPSLLKSGGPSGGGGTSEGGGGGGGGLSGDGATNSGALNGDGGNAFEDAVNPGAGGAGYVGVRGSLTIIGGDGGFGGGGGGAGLDDGGGGGGGYSGGADPESAFGGDAGTSYYNPDFLVGPTPTISPAGLTAADGSLTIDFAPIPAVAKSGTALLVGIFLTRLLRREVTSS